MPIVRVRSQQSDMPDALTAQAIDQLAADRSDEELVKIQRCFKTGEGQYGAGDQFLGVRMGQVFALARDFIDLPPDEIETLLDSPMHEVRAGGLSIMDKQARRKRTPEPQGARRPLPASHRPDHQLGSRGSRLSLRRRRLPARQAA